MESLLVEEVPRECLRALKMRPVSDQRSWMRRDSRSAMSINQKSEEGGHQQAFDYTLHSQQLISPADSAGSWHQPAVLPCPPCPPFRLSSHHSLRAPRMAAPADAVVDHLSQHEAAGHLSQRAKMERVVWECLHWR